MSERHVVAKVAELPPGSRRLVTIRGRDVVVFNVKGEYFALLDRCPHQGGSLSRGKLTGLVEASAPGDVRYSRRGEIIRCPWHGWEYDLRTGRSWCDPARLRVKNYVATAMPGTALVQGPYTAETFDVTVEENYVVVEV
jgi:nitrite reductase/ring-hydroxylating ferredoxin subunit